MRLLVVSHSCSDAINRQIYGEIERANGWEITLVVPAHWKDEFGQILDQPSSSFFAGKLRRIPVVGNGNIILHFYLARWIKLLREGDFDAIYVNHEPYALATAQVVFANWLCRSIPIGFYSCQNLFKRYPPPVCWLEKFVYRQSSFAFPITSDVGEVLKAKGFEGDIVASPLPINPELYHLYPPEERPAQIPPSRGRVTFGYVGRLVEAKGLRTLALALGKLRHQEWHLVVIGSGKFQSEFDRVLGEGGVRDRVTHLGYVAHQETPKYLAAMDVLVLPSETQVNWKEQFGRVIPEALACGAAVIGSSSGEIPHLIHDSGGGLVFPERDVDALVGALEQMISFPEARREMAERGRIWALAHLSTPRVAAQMAAVIEWAVKSQSLRLF